MKLTNAILPTTPLENIFRLTEIQKKGLEKLRVTTVDDLLHYFPARYTSITDIKNIAHLAKGDTATIYGRVVSAKTAKGFKSKIPMTEAIIEDATGHIKCVWFHQAYIAKMLVPDAMVKLSGHVEERAGVLYLANPELVRTHELPLNASGSLFQREQQGTVLYPVYSETKGITSRWIFHHIQKMFGKGALANIIDPIPEDILTRYHLPTLSTALVWIHAPQKESDAGAARKRFAFEEVFMIQLARQQERALTKEHSGFVVEPEKESFTQFTARFPFKPTASQTHALADIFSDLKKGVPMARLLEGDVGSGKTFVAATAAYAVATTAPADNKFGNLQVAYMAPTEILAEQHFKSFIEYFKGLPIEIGLLTGSGAKKFPCKLDPSGATSVSKAQLLKWVAEGKLPILIGTHALIQKSVEFKNLGLAIVDEQHRFGVSQRAGLAGRGRNAEHTRKGAEGTMDSGGCGEIAEEPEDPLLYRDFTYTIREAIFKVKKELGLGHKEATYQKALEEEFSIAKLNFSREKQIPILYQNKKVGIYQPDFVIDDKIIVELKALPFLGTEPKKQLWNYLKGSPYKLGLLVNFGHSELDIVRVVYDKARTSSASVPRKSASIPHLLSMTATPIPRTLALTIYGNLDLTLLDEMPAGRLPIKTKLITKDNRKKMEEHIRTEINNGRQAYIICPRIDEPDPEKEMALQAKSVTAEAKRIADDVFPEFEIGILHGKMKPDEKEWVMAEFKKGAIHILVATSVIEVGVNVPNATIIVIEGAERFGLAQLHQLRGRVIRSNHQAYCYILTESTNENSQKRLKALATAKNGFELAELDLTIRGSGELSGGKQWGISDLGMEAIKNIKMVEAARTEAARIVAEDSELANYPTLQKQVDKEHRDTHWE
ncbi:MAG: GxxExxY protein [Candidatus Yonathbacteria bacterium]|nr:GxxExxY protein [Candidatus Yonathbacteria bacterium]